MKTPLWTRFAACALAALFVGCGGPGSSGFDVVPESTAINTALRDGTCIAQRTLQICPAGVASPGPGPESVSTEEAGPLACAPNDSVYVCGFSLPFGATGFPSTATFRLAAREPVPREGWAVGSPVLLPTTGQPTTDAPVTVDFTAPTEPRGFVSQFAILVFLDGDGALPPRVDRLIETGADFAFVTPPTALFTSLP